MSSTREMLLRPALTGVIAGTTAGVLLGDAGELPTLGMAVSPAVAIGASVAVGSLTASAFNQYVVPKIVSGQQAQAFESGVIGAIPWSCCSFNCSFSYW